jgi:hypothetical protein
MPEHIHLRISEPEVGTPSTVIQVLKQRTARALLPKSKPRDPRQTELFGETPERARFWQTRFNDFNVWTNKKRVEKLRYMAGGPPFSTHCSFFSPKRTEGAPSLRFLQGWAAMLLVA